MKYSQLRFLLLVVLFSIAFVSCAEDLEANPAEASPEQPMANQTVETSESSGSAQTPKINLDPERWESFQQAIDQGELGGYFSVGQVEQMMQYFYSNFSDLIVPEEVIGQSFEKRDIKMYCLTKRNGNTTFDQEAANKTIAYITSLHHPREPMSLSMAIFFMFRILVEYRKNNPQYISLLDNNVVCIIPFVNIDGYNVIEQEYKKSGEFIKIRKNRNAENSNDCPNAQVGIDLNRNYDYCWNHDNQASSPFKCAEEYRGSAPFSEPETQAIKNFVESHLTNLKLAVNLHAYGNLWVFPFNCYEDDSPYKTPRVNSIYQDFANNAPLPPGYKIGNAMNTVGYTANGEATDWLLGEHGILALSPEIGLHGETDETFFAPKDVIYQVVTKDFPGVFYMFSKLNPIIELQSIDSSRIESQNNHKVIYVNLFNNGYRDLWDGKIQVNLTIRDIQDDFLQPILKPTIYLLESSLDGAAFNRIIIDTSDMKVVTQKNADGSTVDYNIEQPVKFKSWNSMQLVTVLPFDNYNAVHIEIGISDRGKSIYNYKADLEGLESITTGKKVIVLLVAILLVIVITFLIIFVTQSYLQSRGVTKSGNMFGKAQPGGLEFAQIRNVDESSDPERA